MKKIRFYTHHMDTNGYVYWPKKAYKLDDTLAESFITAGVAYAEDELPDGWIDPNFSHGGSGIDTDARNLAQQNAAKLAKIYKMGGDTIDAGNEVFVTMADGKIVNYANNTASSITIPASPTAANMKAAGLAELAATGSGTDNRLSNIYKLAGDTVAAGSEVFIVIDTGATVNYRNPTAKSLTVPATVTNTDILAAGFAPIAAKENHLHSILTDSATLAGSGTIFKVADRKLWRNKIANPDIKLTPADAKWGDNWEAVVSDVVPDPALLPDGTIPIIKNKVWSTMSMPDWFNVATVADKDTLKTGEYSKAEPGTGVTFTFTLPAVVKDTWFGLINSGDGTLSVGGVNVGAKGIGFWTSNEAGDAWVFIYGDMDEGAAAKTTIFAGATAPALPDYPALWVQSTDAGFNLYAAIGGAWVAYKPPVSDRLSDGTTTFVVKNGNFVKQR